MKLWPRHPVIYEINTWPWLHALGQKLQRPLELGSVPDAEWDSLAALGIEAVWLMGVWERSPAGVEISMRNPGLVMDFQRALPDFSPADNVGSAYCVRRYVVDEHLGGPAGLAAAREELARRGMRLILDFVPNHVAPDHPWASTHSEYFIQGSEEDLRNDSAAFIAVNGKVLACGRDPFFPAWPDVLQLNVFSPALREAACQTLHEIAAQCDGVRCDMAMLVMNDVFSRTWGARAGNRPEGDYWPSLIPAVKSEHPEFWFLAEAYWDLEWALQQQGFDYCYDKKLRDRMERADAESVRLHLLADMTYQQRLVRFLENHDERRATVDFSPEKARAAAVALLTLPGGKLLFEGQFEGHKVRLPTFLGRAPVEPTDTKLQSFYDRLLTATSHDVFKNGEWRLCERSGWPDNASYVNLLAWSWELGAARYLVAINFSGAASQGLVRLQWDDLPGKSYRFCELLSGEVYERNGDDVADVGFFVSLEPWRWHVLRIELVR